MFTRQTNYISVSVPVQVKTTGENLREEGLICDQGGTCTPG